MYDLSFDSYNNSMEIGTTSSPKFTQKKTKITQPLSDRTGI